MTREFLKLSGLAFYYDSAPWKHIFAEDHTEAFRHLLDGVVQSEYAERHYQVFAMGLLLFLSLGIMHNSIEKIRTCRLF
jgi:hypothetical protein